MFPFSLYSFKNFIELALIFILLLELTTETLQPQNFLNGSFLN